MDVGRSVNRLRDTLAGSPLPESLPATALTLGVADDEHPELAAELECQAFDKKDLKTLAVSLDKASQFAPDPKWNEGENAWVKIAKDGSAAAKAGNSGSFSYS